VLQTQVNSIELGLLVLVGVRNRRLDQFGAELLQHRLGLLEALDHVALRAGEVACDAQAHAAQRLRVEPIERHRGQLFARRAGGGVARVAAGHRLQQQRGVAHAAAHRARRVLRE
jgi:hypothetical protein